MNCGSLVHLFWTPLVQPFSQGQHTSILTFYSWTLHLNQSASLSPGSQPCLGFKAGPILPSSPSLAPYLAPHQTPFFNSLFSLNFLCPTTPWLLLPFSAFSCLASQALLPSFLFFLVHPLSVVQMESDSRLIAPNLSSVFPPCSLYQMVPFALTGFSLWPLFT